MSHVRQTVAIQGERGSFSHQAAMQMLPGCQVLACATSADVAEALSRRTAAAAGIPIENSLAGPVAWHFDLLLTHDFFVSRECRLRIQHNLIAAPGVRLKDVRRVYSHPVALAQCRDFLFKHRQMLPEAFYDTAGAVKHVADQKARDAAAIAGRQA